MQRRDVAGKIKKVCQHAAASFRRSALCELLQLQVNLFGISTLDARWSLFWNCNRHTVEYRNLRLLYQTFNKKLLRLGEGAAFLRVWQKNIIEDDSNTRCFINTKDGTFQLQHQRKTNGKKLSKSESAFSDCFHVMPPLTNGRHGIGVPPAAQRHQWGKNGENILVIFIIAIDNLPK